MRIFFSLIFSCAVMALRGQAPADTVQRVVPGRVNSAEQMKKPYVIFISADGFRHDLADKWQAKHLLALREQGVAAEGMIPSYPSLTFPNHYSLATGLYPSHHGLVDNTFFDRKKGKGYSVGNRIEVEDSSWYGGRPLWVLAEQQRMVSASFFWVGSEAAVAGVRPTYWYRFNDKIGMDRRLQVVKDWLSLPEERRPHLVMFYLSQVDHAEHMYGPDSKEAGAAVQEVDGVIGKMVRMIGELHLPVNYVFVADHGMTNVDTVQGMGLPAAVDTTKFVVSPGEAVLHLYARDKGEAKATDVKATYAALKKEAKDFDVYLPEETPERWHYTAVDDRYERIGDIILVSHHPKIFNLRLKRIIPGMHGFDNKLADMHATFYAWGPAFKEHMKIGEFENVNV
ncbi:MAG TPA: ectonucleotide pyrophosphatase/phosphodiesterase, partial [Puia sp.]